ncbi:MAG: 4Fe-4S dicluster domain-containing protein, partial [Chitinophagales bacterium]|nr:4Fe-4S dicluster domain-containing protein [Chitinophagales bacterium]
CTRCIDACPTDAIYEPYKVDATKCISYLTIEHKGEIDKKYHTDIQNWVFGCDICQDVCPWNSKAKLTQLVDLQPRPKVIEASGQHFQDLDLETFNALFTGSPVRRAKWLGFERNLRLVQKNIQR